MSNLCVVVTRQGFGDLWLHESRSAAYLHPLTQYGDTILERPLDVAEQYSTLEWCTLRTMAGLPTCEVPVRAKIRVDREFKEGQAGLIFERLLQRAQPAPTDPAEICRRIQEDRRRTDNMAKRKANTEFPAEAGAVKGSETGAGAKAVKVAGVPFTKGPKGVPLGSIIRMGADKEGRTYGPDHNPKKAGSATHGRFACYRDGMTVQEALDAGVLTGDMTYDRDKGFIFFEEVAAEVGETEGSFSEAEAE